LNSRTKLLSACLAISLAFAGWTWMRPYEWSRDAGARYRIVYASVKPDHAYCWLALHLKRAGDQPHDLLKPVRLILADGREVEPSDFSQVAEPGFPEIDYRFYLEAKDLSGPLRLKLNDGTLAVRKESGPLPVTDSTRYFNTANW